MRRIAPRFITGATPEDSREALPHVAIYAGVPAANHGREKEHGKWGWCS